MESNKTFAAILLAGIISLISGFASNMLVPTETLAKNAFVIEGVVASADTTQTKAATAEPSLEDLMAKADMARGKKLSRKCSSCHTFDPKKGNRVGPNLGGLFGRDVANISNFKYSKAMKAKGGKWTAENLDAFLKKPRVAVPHTKMSFPGIKKAEDRAALIKWLKAQK